MEEASTLKALHKEQEASFQRLEGRTQRVAGEERALRLEEEQEEECVSAEQTSHSTNWPQRFEEPGILHCALHVPCSPHP